VTKIVTVHKGTQLTTDLIFTRLTKSQCDAVEKMVMTLASYIKHQNEQSIPLSGAIFHEKVRNLYEDVTKDAEKQSLFALSYSWLSSFECHHSFSNFKMIGNPAAASCAAKELPSLFKVTIVEGGYTVKQVFNLD
jgi:hypothetical protein